MEVEYDVDPFDQARPGVRSVDQKLDLPRGQMTCGSYILACRPLEELIDETPRGEWRMKRTMFISILRV